MQSTISNARAFGRFCGVAFLATLAAIAMTLCSPAPAHAAVADADLCSYLGNVAGKSTIVKAQGLPLNELLTELRSVPNLSPELVADITKAIRYGYSLPEGSDPYAAAEFYFKQCMLPKA